MLTRAVSFCLANNLRNCLRRWLKHVKAVLGMRMAHCKFTIQPDTEISDDGRFPRHWLKFSIKINFNSFSSVSLLIQLKSPRIYWCLSSESSFSVFFIVFGVCVKVLWYDVSVFYYTTRKGHCPRFAHIRKDDLCPRGNVWVKPPMYTVSNTESSREQMQ